MPIWRWLAGALESCVIVGPLSLVRQGFVSSLELQRALAPGFSTTACFLQRFRSIPVGRQHKHADSQGSYQDVEHGIV